MIVKTVMAVEEVQIIVEGSMPAEVLVTVEDAMIADELMFGQDPETS